MTYVRVADGFADTGSFGAWYDSLSFDRALMAQWARRLDPSLPGDDNALIARIAQPPELGGGFVAGGQRMCLSNRPGGPTEPLRAVDQPCPPGSGGVMGEQVHELSAEEIRQQIEEQRQAEEAGRAQPPVPVEVTGSVQKAGTQTLTSVTITTGMTGSTHPTFGGEPGGEPLPDLTVEIDGQSARTGTQGRFTIRAQAPGLVSGVVRDSVGKRQEAVLVVIGAGSAVTDRNGSFRIPLYAVNIRGRVVDGFGRAIVGATVEIEADPLYRSGRFDAGGYYGIPYSARSSAYIAASTLTNDSGVFSIKVPTGSYAVKVRASGFQDRRQGGITLGIGMMKNVGDVVLLAAGSGGAGSGGAGSGGAGSGTTLPGDGVPKEEPGLPWYKSTWFWVGTAAVAVGGVGYMIWRQRKAR